ncbi:hypothetical protein N1851_020392 [Merluccius polli]|uniref:Uncharacterized protein n=1 Tax=Merluccius polli TaxID=89951 RepID=A0AA47NX13_MERPO|nr:hypothetical protein N1851_020392 [Merluccius polli]
MLSALLDSTKRCTCVMAPSKEHIKLFPFLHLGGGGDHNCIHLIPSYCTAEGKNQGCYECTDWEMFKESCLNIDVLTDVVSCYVSFCEDNVIPEKTVKVYPIRNLPELENLKKEVKHEIARAKRRYKEKLEDQLGNNNSGSAWDSMKTIIGTKEIRNTKLVLDGFTCDRKLAQTLNEFYLRFDTPTFKDAILEQKNKRIVPQCPLICML